jgi:hypothetical protein
MALMVEYPPKASWRSQNNRVKGSFDEAISSLMMKKDEGSSSQSLREVRTFSGTVMGSRLHKSILFQPDLPKELQSLIIDFRLIHTRD